MSFFHPFYLFVFKFFFTVYFYSFFLQFCSTMVFFLVFLSYFNKEQKNMKLKKYLLKRFFEYLRFFCLWKNKTKPRLSDKNNLFMYSVKFFCFSFKFNNNTNLRQHTFVCVISIERLKNPHSPSSTGHSHEIHSFEPRKVFAITKHLLAAFHYSRRHADNVL